MSIKFSTFYFNRYLAMVADTSYIDILKAQASTSTGLSESSLAAVVLSASSSEVDRPYVCEGFIIFAF